MKKTTWCIFPLCALLIAPSFCQTDISDNNNEKQLYIGYFGPRVGIAFIPNSLYDSKTHVALHTLFGFQMDMRYESSNYDFVGYGESGFLLSAVEQGVFYPELWGYIGIRKPYGFGLGIGPNISKHGVGIGISPQYIFKIDNLLVPIIFNIILTDNKTRCQFLSGFDYDKIP